MKKVFGFTFGGLQKRALALVLVMIAVMVAVFAGISFYQSRMLSDVVGETRREQQRAISQVSSATMHGVLEETLVEITGLQAQIADDDFSEVVSGVRMLCTMAQGLLDNRDEIEPEEVGLPDPALNGQSSAMVLCEEGVDWTQSELLGIIAHMSEPMIAMHRNSEKIDGCYIGLADGTDLCVDDKSLNKLDSSGKPIPFPVRERPWYTGAVEAGGIFFTGIMQDAFSGKYVITCSAPIETDGEIAGVVGIDVVLESMDGFIASSDKSSGYAYIVNESGEVVLGSQGGLFSDESEDWYENEDAERAGLAEFIRRSLGEKTGLTSLTVHQRPFYAVGAPMPTVGWAVITAVERQVTELPEMRMLVEYDRINNEGSAKFQAGNAKAGRTVLVVVALIVAVGAFAAMMAANRMVKPVENMTRDIVLSAQTGQFFEMKDCYRTDDEIEMLAEAFDNLSKKTKRYIEEITEITREKERANTELQMAALIQNSMLPHIFPPFPDRPEIDLYALMDPAREVGGDFYDYFLIDEDHLCMVMADVSGKGVPAALFMMISKVILQSCAMLDRISRLEKSYS
ncbi:MAG: SpoIIE family protein phosphatase, partial [Lachnospiraceae bacterium]|nr:SpoIIE family protein phosphatase [Lachnospiraceae bacterium]